MTDEDQTPDLQERRVLETYRYLRIGLIGAAALLAISVFIERLQVDCWQESISGYYYTPARGVFVGTLVAVGLVLIVIKGEGREDLYLNLAGMLAPVVAFVPTTVVGRCWSIEPRPSPLVGPGELAPWVIANVENNMWALIVTGLAGLVLAAFLYWRTQDSFLWPFQVGDSRRAITWGMFVVAAIILGAGGLLLFWDDFALRAHDAAAIAMFAFLALASAWNARRARSAWYRRIYWLIAVAMVATVVLIGLLYVFIDGWTHAILWLEFIEIGLFATYWIVQTTEHWGEEVTTTGT